MPIPLLPIAYAALSAAPSIFGFSKAREQKKQAEELARIKNPYYQIPKAATEALTIARLEALKTKIPGYDAITGKIGASTAGQIRNIQQSAASPVESIAAGAAAVGQQQDALANLGIAGEEMYARNKGVLRGELGNMAGWQEKQQQWNVLDPYLRAKATESALRNASNVNTMNAIRGVTGAVAGGLLLSDQQGAVDSTGGTKSSPTTPTTWNPSPIYPDASSQWTPPQSILSPELRQIAIKKYRMTYPDSLLTDEEILATVHG